MGLNAARLLPSGQEAQRVLLPDRPFTENARPNYSRYEDEGGFDPRPFLPEPLRATEWRERGYGELRIPHRIHEFANRVTSTRNELLVLNCLIRFSLGFHRSWCEAGYSFICAWTGISDATNVRKSLRRLISLGVVRKARDHVCASNTGSIYELPVVQAYLAFLETGEPVAQSRPPSGPTAPGVNQLETSGWNTSAPTGKTPPKKESINKKNKETLSQPFPPELVTYLGGITAPSKRQSEAVFLNKLLQHHSAEQVCLCLNYVVKNGTLGTREACHSPMKYLATAIDDVLEKAGPVKCDPGQIDNVPASTPEVEELSGIMVLQSFEKDATEAEKAKYLFIAEKENSFPNFIPPPSVIKILAAGLWAKAGNPKVL